MGLNLAKIAAMQTVAAQQTNIPGKAEVAAGIVSLEALKNLTPVLTKPVESAGTINFNQVSAQIIELDAAIKASHPRMPGLLQEIWTTLDKYPECVTLLREDEMEIVIAGLEKVVDTDLAAITLKSATTGGKKSKVPLTAAGLGF
jgi:hypothetical protein